jgi:hypothetical protein
MQVYNPIAYVEIPVSDLQRAMVFYNQIKMLVNLDMLQKSKIVRAIALPSMSTRINVPVNLLMRNLKPEHPHS